MSEPAPQPMSSSATPQVDDGGASLIGRSITPPVPNRLRGHAVAVATFLLLGVIVGALWHQLLPPAQEWSDAGEDAVASDALLTLLLAGAGLLTSAAVWARRSWRTAQRLMLCVLAGGLASAVAVGVGVLLGAPLPQAWAVLLIWSSVVAAASLVWSIAASFTAQRH